MDDCHIIGSQRKLRHTHMLLPGWASIRFGTITRPSPHETIKAKLPSTLPVGVEPVLRSFVEFGGDAPHVRTSDLLEE